jgi:hypothetical protein
MTYVRRRNRQDSPGLKELRWAESIGSLVVWTSGPYLREFTDVFSLYFWSFVRASQS